MNKMPVKESGAGIIPQTERERVDFRPFFAPRSVAVIGASPKPGNLGRMIVHSLKDHQYPGEIFTVHPSGASIAGCPAVTDIQHEGGASVPAQAELATALIQALSKQFGYSQYSVREQHGLPRIEEIA